MDIPDRSPAPFANICLKHDPLVSNQEPLLGRRWTSAAAGLRIDKRKMVNDLFFQEPPANLIG